MSWQERDNFGGSFGDGGDWREKLRRILHFSFPVGTYLDIRVRVNIWFFVVPVTFLSMGMRNLESSSLALQYTLVSTALLFLSVLLHEFGHCLGCRSVGGFANEILMWPLGGLAFTSPPQTVWAHFITVAAGPFVSFMLMLIPFVVLLALPGDSPASLMPFAMINWQQYIAGGPVTRLLTDIFALNYVLLLFNLCLVFYPFDGGRLVQVAAWKLTNYRKSMIWAVRFGMIGAVVIGVLGLVTSFWLVLIAVFGFISSYQQGQQLRDEGAYEPWQQSLEMDPTRPERKGWWQRRRDAKAAKKAAAANEKKRKLEAEVDRILDKVHREGLQSLTPKEKKVLQQATDARAQR